MKKVVFLFGMNSTEHFVSCHSAQSILEAVDNKKYEVHSIYISKENEWYHFNQDFEALYQEVWLDLYQDNKIENVFQELKKYDVVFPVMHGQYGEDGCIQGLCELLNIPYVGCSVRSSAACYDKVFTKELLNQHSIKQVPSMTIYQGKYKLKELEKELSYPMIVKPAKGGSSIGIQVAKTSKELRKAIDEATKYDNKVLVEKFIEARELECAVLEQKYLYASSIGEIFAANDFYDYNAKYENNQSYTVINPKIPRKIGIDIKRISKLAFRALDCSGLARVDFLYCEKTNELYLNEINTLPGFTNISMYPQLLIHDHISYSRLISILIEHAKTKK